jgi:hypothetical protein
MTNFLSFTSDEVMAIKSAIVAVINNSLSTEDTKEYFETLRANLNYQTRNANRVGRRNIIQHLTLN